MMKKLKNLAIAAVFILFWLSLISIDSETLLPAALCVVSWLFLAVVAWRRGWLYDPEKDEAE